MFFDTTRSEFNALKRAGNTGARSKNSGKSALLSATLAALFILPSSISSHADDKEETPGLISVVGEGTSPLAPDMAVVSLSVLREAKTASDALAENSTAMRDILAAMTAAGIAQKDLQTSNFTIHPQYVYPKSSSNTPQPPRIVGYQVTNGLTVRVRDLSILGSVLDEAVSLGVNQGGNIQFTNDDPEDALTGARTKAMQAAMAKAETLAAAGGVELGRIVSISESTARPFPRAMARAEMAMAADSSVPIAAGENTYSVTVNVTFEIDQ